MVPTIDISKFENAEPVQEKSEIIFVQIGLSVLSGFIFGFIWLGFLMNSFKEILAKSKGALVLRYLLCAIVPFGSIAVLIGLRKELVAAAEQKGVSVKLPLWLLIALSVIFPILPINIVALSLIQNAVNKIYEA